MKLAVLERLDEGSIEGDLPKDNDAPLVLVALSIDRRLLLAECGVNVGVSERSRCTEVGCWWIPAPNGDVAFGRVACLAIGVGVDMELP